MLTAVYRGLPPEGVKIGLVLFLSFLLGLEREEHKSAGAEYAFGGVRTFPLIGLIGYATTTLSGDQRLPIVLGMAVIAAFMLLSYSRKLQSGGAAGVTSEVSALATYLVGALVARDAFWIATTLSVAGLFLLELKTALEGLTKRVAAGEILTFTKFLLLTAVILPILPNRALGPVGINPFKTWLVVVAVSSISYGSYVIREVTEGRGGLVLAAVLGGAYSSTVTTVVLSREAARERRPHLVSGATLMASGMMYLRLAALVGLFSRPLLALVGLPFLGLAALALGGGWAWSRIADGRDAAPRHSFDPKNPLELGAALVFAILFLAMLTATHLALAYLGRVGLYSLAALMGLTDIDPFVMGLTQAGGQATPLATAAAAILIAASSNNFIKGVYAYVACDRKTGVMSLLLLVGLAAAGLAPLAF